jgi:hypothetical protein
MSVAQATVTQKVSHLPVKPKYGLPEPLLNIFPGRRSSCVGQVNVSRKIKWLHTCTSCTRRSAPDILCYFYEAHEPQLAS